MLHLLWPFLWIWAMMYRPDRGWGFGQKPGEPTSPKEAVAELEELRHRLAEVEARLEIENRKARFGEGQLQPGSSSPGSMISAVEKENVAAAGATPAVSQGAQR
jgi:hypothetical protein